MAKQNDLKKVVENRVNSIDSHLDAMTPGSEQYSRLVGDMASLVRATAEVKKVEVMAEDNEAKLEEQKRMNDEELRLKESQLEVEAFRAKNEQSFKARQLKQDIMRLAVDSALTGFAQIGYFGMTRRVMNTEYKLTDGSSVLPPNGVNRALNDWLKPKKKF